MDPEREKRFRDSFFNERKKIRNMDVYAYWRYSRGWPMDIRLKMASIKLFHELGHRLINSFSALMTRGIYYAWKALWTSDKKWRAKNGIQ